MKKPFFLLLISLSFNSIAVVPSAQNTVDQYVKLALTLDEKELKGTSSNWTCNYSFMHDVPASGKTLEEANLKTQLRCVKKQCQKLLSEVESAVQDLKNLPDSDYHDFLEFSGKSPEEIEAAMEERRNNYPVNREQLTCLNSPEFRTLAVDTCMALPVSCNEKKGWFF